MRNTTKRSRALVAVRPFGGEQCTSRTAAFGLLFVIVAMAMLFARVAKAEPAATPAPPPFTAAVVEFGSEPPSDTAFYFPDLSKVGGAAAGWRDLPKSAMANPGEGFPKTFTVKCKVKADKGTVTVSCPKDVVGKTLRGRLRGVIGLRTWSDVDGAMRLGVTMYVESLSVPGHVYLVTVKGAPAEHNREVVLKVEPTTTTEVEAELTLSHAEFETPPIK